MGHFNWQNVKSTAGYLTLFSAQKSELMGLYFVWWYSETLDEKPHLMQTTTVKTTILETLIATSC